MKKIVLLILATMAMFGAAHAYDFSAVAPSGQTLYYDILGGGDVSVTYPDRHYSSALYSYSYYYDYPRPIGCLIIPDSVMYAGSVYRVTGISDHAFYDCSGLASVSLPNSVTSIGDHAFYYCSGLASVSLPNSITSIGDYAFFGCSGLTSHLYNNTLFVFMPTSFTGGYAIPDGINTICDGAFYGCTELSSITIPNTVTSIGNYAFSGCSSLPSVTIPNSVTSIGSYAFQGCDQLSSITIPSPVTRIEDGTFSGCLRLTAVSFSDNVMRIGNEAFYNCGIIGELVIPQSVTEIGYQGFGGCYGITEITCLGRVAPMLGGSTFEGVDSSITVNIPCGSTNLYAGRWPQFDNFNEIPFLFNAISENINRGTVTVEQEPTCDNPYAVIRATPRTGYHFDHWSDGSTENPYSYTATGSVTLIGYFAGDVGIDNTDGSYINVVVADERITVEGAEGETVRIYDMMGRMVASVAAGTAVRVPDSGVYLVKVGEAAAEKIFVIR